MPYHAGLGLETSQEVLAADSNGRYLGLELLNIHLAILTRSSKTKSNRSIETFDERLVLSDVAASTSRPLLGSRRRILRSIENVYCRVRLKVQDRLGEAGDAMDTS